jgi:hypothetical protein
MFDSPIEYCPRLCDWIALDEGLEACACRHGCERHVCVLASCFPHAAFAGVAAGTQPPFHARAAGRPAPGLRVVP